MKFSPTDFYTYWFSSVELIFYYKIWILIPLCSLNLLFSILLEVKKGIYLQSIIYLSIDMN